MHANITNATTHGKHWERFGGLCGLTNTTGLALYITILFLLAIVSTTGNLMILIVIFKNKVFQTPSLLLLGVLAILDLFAGCVVTPIKAIITIEITSMQLIYTFHWLFAGVIFLTLSTMLLISLDRFLHVILLERYNYTKLKIVGALLIWIVPLAVMALFQFAAFAVFFYFFCIAAIVLLHIGIICGIQRHSLNEAHGELIAQQRKAASTALLIIITFISMTIIPVLTFIFIMADFFWFIRQLCALTYFFMLAHSAVNPVIYCFRVPLMKDHLARLVWKEYGRDNDTTQDPNNPHVIMTEEYIDGVMSAYPDYANCDVVHDTTKRPAQPQRVELGRIEEVSLETSSSDNFQIEISFDSPLEEEKVNEKSDAKPSVNPPVITFIDTSLHGVHAIPPSGEVDDVFNVKEV